MTAPEAASYTRYLKAKKSIDDRSLNRRVWETARRAVREREAASPGPAPLQVLEVGAGAGAMIARSLEWGLLYRATYAAIDVRPGFVEETASTLSHWAQEAGARAVAGSGSLELTLGESVVDVHLERVDALEFLRRPSAHSKWDVLIASAFLDLVDLDTALPPLLSTLSPGGVFYFPINFDGATIFEPPTDPELDALIERLYHQTMDNRRINGAPSGDSRTGRLLFGRLRRLGAEVLDVGASDWVVAPGAGGYSPDEAVFLDSILDTIFQALTGHPELDQERLGWWVEQRRSQAARGELLYIAHQLDYCGRLRA